MTILLFISKRRSAPSALRTKLADRRGVQQTTRCVKCHQRDGLWPVACGCWSSHLVKHDRSELLPVELVPTWGPASYLCGGSWLSLMFQPITGIFTDSTLHVMQPFTSSFIYIRLYGQSNHIYFHLHQTSCSKQSHTFSLTSDFVFKPLTCLADFRSRKSGCSVGVSLDGGRLCM